MDPATCGLSTVNTHKPGPHSFASSPTAAHGSAPHQSQTAARYFELSAQMASTVGKFMDHGSVSPASVTPTPTSTGPHQQNLPQNSMFPASESVRQQHPSVNVVSNNSCKANSWIIDSETTDYTACNFNSMTDVGTKPTEQSATDTL
ncbi:unnamed protein product [Dovyalis caffra]|uniref:Uncharacterized protein n=1 Tax=Dovyalis caffra TaxID=77055 RepID=A0AAV1SNK6_9ROSI|nr:unnamed protein product [Dovyalis caffra]